MNLPLPLLRRCISICEQLCDCLDLEKTALIAFDIESLLENNLKKENLVRALVDCRAKLRKALVATYGVNTKEKVLAAVAVESKPDWEKVFDQWEQCWEHTQIKCKQNQRFIQHSLKNVGMFADHLKELFGANTVYSDRGMAIDKSTEGAVVEGKY